MSKELAQTVGGKKIAVLFVILAALTVFATLGNQWRQDAEAAISASSLNADAAGPVIPGATRTITASATTNGTGATSPTTLTLSLPAGVTAAAPVFDADCAATITGAPGGAAYQCTTAGIAPASTVVSIAVTVTFSTAANNTAPLSWAPSGTATDGAAAPAALTVGGNLPITVNYPNLSITKSVTPATIAAAGGTGTYTITVANTVATGGQGSASNISFTDQFDATKIATMGTPVYAGWSANPSCAINAALLMTCTAGGLTAGPDTGTIDIPFTTQSNIVPGTVVTNTTGSVLATEISNTVAGASANFTVSSTQSASLTITPTKSSITGTPAEAFAWIYTVTNTGTAPLTGVAITDASIAEAASIVVAPATQDNLNGFAGCDVAANAFTGTCVIGALSAGSSASIVVGMSSVNGSANGVVSNGATANATELAAPVTATSNVTINNNPILAITKSFSTATVGQTATSTYTWTVTNVGAATANGVVVTDAVPAGLTGSAPTVGSTGGTTVPACSLTGGSATTMPTGATLSCTVTVVITAGNNVAAGSSFVNTASVVSTEMPVAISASATVNAVAPALAIVKSSSAGNINPGAGVNFTVTVTNTGTDTATTFTIVDTVPASLVVGAVTDDSGPVTCNTGVNAVSCTGTLAAGASVTVTIPVTLAAGVVNGTVITNIATADAAETAPVSDDAAITAQVGQLTITKTNSPQTIQPGGLVTSTITVTNIGGYPVNGVAITDTLPAGSVFQPVGSSAGCSAVGVIVTCTGGSIISGSSLVWTVKFNAPAAPGAYQNTVVTSNTSGVGNVSYAASFWVAAGQSAEIRHMADNGGPVTGAWSQDVPSNDRGSRHTICVVEQNSGLGFKIADLRTSISAADTTVVVQTATGNANWPAGEDNGGSIKVGDTIRIDSESMYVTAVAGPDGNGVVTLTVIRGVGGSTAATHTGSGTSYTDVAGADVSTTHPLQIPVNNLSQVSVSSGGGYTSLADPDPTMTDVRIFVGDGTATGRATSTLTAGLQGATCVSWVSTEAGDQEITLLYTAIDGVTPLQAAWDTDGDANDNVAGTVNSGNRALIKEWNVLEDSCLTLSGGYVGSGCGTSTTTPVVVANVPSIFNPATSRYDFTDIVISDYFRGSHIMRTGAKWGPAALAGVSWTNGVLSTGSCGALINSNGATGMTWLMNDSTVGNGPLITFTPDQGVACGIGSWAEITFTGFENGPIGSGTGVTVTQKVLINIVTPPLPTKQIFLAWAGQRVILEHDWRLMPGDVDGGASTSVAPLGICPFYVAPSQTAFWVDYIKGSGPGNFLSGLTASLNGSDQASVLVEASDNSQTDSEDIISQPQGSCISRVLYESEDQGQVDIEAFVRDQYVLDPLNQTKIAFVIYYMKLESATVSLVKDVSKPSHNSSTYAYADWNPGNPWDASKDVSTVDWNVSKDLLVRVRVKGWFTTSNATGRAAGTDTNGGVLPAGRWVMPDDWPLLAGGPADPADGSDATGIAEAYRPEFDIMIAPNNKLGRSLLNPEGTVGDVAVTTVAVAMGGTAATTTVTVASAANIPVGACIVIDSEVMSVTLKVGNVLTVTRVASPGLNCSGTTTVLAAHAVGALVIILNLTGVPFEGPYSLLDIPGLAASGFGGAALSNWDPNNIRDTIWGDGDVDMWDAPMPPSLLTVSIRGSGFIKQVLKESAYYIGTANASGQVFPNPFYITNIPDSPFIPSVVAGGGYFWDSWGLDGPGGAAGDGVYRFWWPVIIGSNMWGVGDTTVTATQAAELAAIRTAYGDSTIARDLVVYTDNHGEAMVAANGDFKLDYSGCAANALAGGKHCAPGDKAGASTITAVADYPDFRGKHYPLLSNVATVNWTWGGYKDVTIEDGETEQYKYVVFHGMDRDGFCYAAPLGSVQLHPVWTGHGNNTFNNNPSELIDFMIDSGEGIIIGTSNGASSSSQYTKQFAEGVPTFSTYANDPAVSGIKEFGLSSLATTGAVDECQAWVKVSNSLLGILDILVIAHDDEGNIGFDKIIDLQSTMSYSLSFRWTLFTWAGKNNIATADALKGSGGSTNDITSSVTAVYGWNAAAQAWLGYFPSAVPVPGANDLTKLTNGDAYWIAITGPGSVTWTIATNVD